MVPPPHEYGVPRPNYHFHSSKYSEEIDHSSIHWCDCGYTNDREDNYNEHRSTCEQATTVLMGGGSVHQQDIVQRQESLRTSQNPSFLDLEPCSSVPSRTARPNGPRPPQEAQPPPDSRTWQQLPNDELFASNPLLQPESSSLAQGDVAKHFADAFVSPPPPQQRQPDIIRENDPFLNLHARNWRHPSHQSDPSVAHPFSFPHAFTLLPKAQRPATHGRNTLNPNAAAAVPVGNLFQRTRQKRDHTPKDDEGGDALAKRRKVDAEKQRKCRQRKADNQEALEAEVQRLRFIMDNLGGCGEGVEIEDRNWH